MSKRTSFIDYPERAREFAYRFPNFAVVSTHVNFWVIAYLFLDVLVYLHYNAINGFTESLPVFHFDYSLLLVSFSGVFFGLSTGFIDLGFKNTKIQYLSTGLRMLVKGLLYFLSFNVLWFSMQNFIEQFLVQRVFADWVFLDDPEFNFYIGSTYAVYTFGASFLLSYILQVNTKFGPGKLIPILFGKYHNPEVENRIFLFLDLNNSTGIAEKLGHLRYSSLIRDCFLDVNRSAQKFNAEIYQYVGDEAVLTWKFRDNKQFYQMIDCFFDFKELLQSKRDVYYEKYGVEPTFQGGANQGDVTTIEVGEFKREIAYHGDTINTASRILDMGKRSGDCLVISSEMIPENCEIEGIRFIPQGEEVLRGKEISIRLTAVQKVS